MDDFHVWLGNFLLPAEVVQARNNSFQRSQGSDFKTWAERERNMSLHSGVSGNNGTRKGGA